MIRVDFPDPLTPVMQINFPSGILRFTFFKLFPFAPFKVINFQLPSLRESGTEIALFPERYSPVIEEPFKPDG